MPPIPPLPPPLGSTLGRRIFLALLSLVGVVLGLALATTLVLRQVGQAHRERLSVATDQVVHAERLRSASEREARKVRSFLLTRDARYRAELDEARTAFDEELARLGQVPLPADARALLDRARGAHAPLVRATDTLLAARERGLGAEAAGRRLESAVQPLRDAVDAHLSALELALGGALQVARERAAGAEVDGYRALLVAGLSAALGAVLLGVWLARALRTLRDREERLRDSLLAAQQSQAFEQQVTSIVGHDLRSPLAAIHATASHLLLRGGLEPSQARAVERVARGAARMRTLLQTLLDFTHSQDRERLPLAPRPCDLHLLAHRVVEAFQSTHPGRSVRLLCEGDGQGVWDPDRLTQVLWNLVDNALRYSPEDAPVLVRASTDPLGARLEVYNAGAPIPAELLAGLFEPFRRGTHVDATVRLSVGLGLYLTQEMVRAHGGSIQVRSSPEEGTVFAVRLPLRVEAPSLEDEEAPLTAGHSELPPALRADA